MALSKNRIKYIRSLELKKNRKADKVFLAEGPKLVGDLLGHFRCHFLIATAEWLSAHRQLPVCGKPFSGCNQEVATEMPQ